MCEARIQSGFQHKICVSNASNHRKFARRSIILRKFTRFKHQLPDKNDNKSAAPEGSCTSIQPLSERMHLHEREHRFLHRKSGSRGKSPRRTLEYVSVLRLLRLRRLNPLLKLGKFIVESFLSVIIINTLPFEAEKSQKIGRG